MTPTTDLIALADDLENLIPRFRDDQSILDSSVAALRAAASPSEQRESDADLEKQARELLAKEYDADYPSYAKLARDPKPGAFTMCSVRAIMSALATAPKPVSDSTRVAIIEKWLREHSTRERCNEAVAELLDALQSSAHSGGTSDDYDLPTANDVRGILAPDGQKGARS